MKNRFTLILLAVAVVALGYFFFVEQPRHKHRVASDVEATQLTAVVPDDVTEVVVERPDVVLDLRREGDEWEIRRPVEDNAEPGAVNVLVHAITGGHIERRFQVEASALADFGLAPPQATVRLLDRSGEPLLQLDIGSLTMTSEFAYARAPDAEDVLLVPTGIRRYALRTTFEFRSKIVASFDADDATGLTLATTDKAMRWWKTENDQWLTREQGDTLRGDEDLIVSLLRRLLAVRAGGFVDDAALAASLFEAPAGTLTVDTGGEPLRFTFATADSLQCYIASSTTPRVARVDAAILDILLLGVADLRDRHVVAFDASSIERIALETPDLSLSIVKRGPEWTFSNPDFGEVDQAGVRVLLRELGNLLFRRILQERLRDGAAWGMKPAPYRIRLFDGDDRLVDFLEAGAVQPQGGIRYATSRSGHLGTVDTEPLDQIEALFRDFRTP